MNSISSGIRDLVFLSHENAVEKGNYADGPRNIGETLALLHAEISQALYEVNNGFSLTTTALLGTEPIGFATEMADIVIGVADLCGHLGIDLATAINQKMIYNKTLPHKHGKKL